MPGLLALHLCIHGCTAWSASGCAWLFTPMGARCTTQRCNLCLPLAVLAVGVSRGLAIQAPCGPGGLVEHEAACLVPFLLAAWGRETVPHTMRNCLDSSWQVSAALGFRVSLSAALRRQNTAIYVTRLQPCSAALVACSTPRGAFKCQAASWQPAPCT